MKKISIIDWILYTSAKGLSFVFTILPMGFSLWIARRIGIVVYHLNQKRRSIGYVNLKAAFGERFTSRQRFGIIKGVCQNLAQNAIEMLSLPKIDLRYIERFVKIENVKRIDDALAKKRGVILLTAHYGNWELASIVLSLKGYHLKVLVREQKFPLLNQFLNNIRESRGCSVISKGMSIRGIIESLKKGEVVGILADQDAGKRGVFVDFFGRSASTASGAIRLALDTNATILPTFMVREKESRHKLIIERPLEISDKDIQSSLQNFSKTLESYITRYPSHWLWMHKRWKSTSSRSVLVLSDRKLGHTNQALAILKEIRSQKPEARSQVIEVQFKNRFTRRLLAICSLFASRYCQGCMRCVKFCLKKESYEELTRAYFDIIISCGSSVAAVNLFLSCENFAKSIVIMKPGLLSLTKFSLNIIPSHNHHPSRSNVLITEGAPNQIDPKAIMEDAEKLKSLCQLSLSRINGPRIGLLLGGDTKRYSLSRPIMERVLSEVKTLVEKLEGELFVTTSRRTSGGIEVLVKEGLGNFARCLLLIIANEKNIEGVVGGIMGLSDIVVVSGDSISMVSESAGSGKYVIVILPEPFPTSRHRIFLEDLAKKGYIFLTRPEEIGERIEELWQGKPEIKIVTDKQVIYEAVKRLL